MAIVRKYIKPILNERECFRLWLELGSLRKVSDHLRSKGTINPKTGRPFTTMGIRNSAYRWVLKNIEEAKPLYYSEGFVGDDEDWDKFIIDTARNIILEPSVTVRPFMKFIRENDFEKYEYFYEKWVTEESIRPFHG